MSPRDIISFIIVDLPQPDGADTIIILPSIAVYDMLHYVENLLFYLLKLVFHSDNELLHVGLIAL